MIFRFLSFTFIYVYSELSDIKNIVMYPLKYKEYIVRIYQPPLMHIIAYFHVFVKGGAICKLK